MARLGKRMVGSQRRWRQALLLLCLLATGTVQFAATAHWHKAAESTVSAAHRGSGAPARDGVDRDGCLLCQVAAHAATVAPPPAPWALVVGLESGTAADSAAHGGFVVLQPSHNWQGRAPPRV